MAQRQDDGRVWIVVFVGLVTVERVLRQHEPLLAPAVRALDVEMALLGVGASEFLQGFDFLLDGDGRVRMR